MMDTKGTKIKRKGPRRSIPKSLPVNEVIYRCSWTGPLLSSGTAGSISTSSLGFTISNSTEYSALSTIYSEVRLLSAKVCITPRGANSLTNISRIMGGYHVEYNSTTNTAPTQFSSVANTQKRFTVCSNITRPFIYKVPVPKNLEFTAINADCPTLPTPFAGSPGVIMIYGTNFQASVDYFTMDYLDVTYHVKGRV